MDRPAEGWFKGSFGAERFDFVRLDNRDMDQYLLANVTTVGDGSE